MVVFLGKNVSSFWALLRKKSAPKHEDENKLSVHYNASQHQQENVFFPATRQPYLEDLHLEAQEGLLSLQQQEKQKLVRHGIDVPDDTSVQSSQVDAEMEFRGRSQSFVAENTVEDSLAIRSEMIQRRGSTFKPHANARKAGNKPERERKPRRTTIVGIPQHVAKELGFNKVQHAKGHEEMQMKPEYSDSISLVGLPSQQNIESNHTGDTVHIPTVNGAVQENSLQGPGVRVSLQNIDAHQPLVSSESEANLQKHIQKVYYDDLHLGWRTAAKMSPQLRPKSLAVPGMTTGNFHNDRPSPVMLISPQATYLSKIVPNAVLPASVDLVAISRNSVRTLSRASLVAPSPASVRSCIQFSIQNYDSRHHSSSSENWSHSQSTETIVSNSSTISSKGSHGGVFCKNGVTVENNQKSYNEFQKPLMDQLKVTNTAQNSHGFFLANQTGSNSINTDLSPACSVSSVADTSDTASIKSGRSFRNLSVRKVKKVPAPPKRTYSLHQQETNVKEHKTLKKDVIVPVDGLGPSADDALSPNSLSETSSVQSESLTYSADYSSSDVSRCSESPLVRNQLVKKDLNFKGQQLPHDFSPQKLNGTDKFDRTMSPSSGYSSQSGTPTLSTKGLISYPPSPGKKRALPTKPERTCSLQSPAVSVSSSLTSLSSAASDPVPAEQMTTSMDAPITSEVTTVMTTTVSVTAMSNSTENDAIPPHPKVSAPQSPPPPEVRDKATSMLTVINASMSRKPSMSKRIKEKLAAVSASASPPPSPPPSHQPPPPPVKNVISVSEAAVVPSSLLPSPCVSSEVAQIPKVEPSWPLPPPPALEELVTSKERLPTSGEMDFSSVNAEAKTVVDNVTHPTTDKNSLEIPPQEDSVASQPAIPTPPPPPPLPSMLQPICSDSNHVKNISASLLPKTYLPVPFTKIPEQKQLEMQVPEPGPPPAPSPPPPPFLKTSGQLQRSFQKRASTSSNTGTKEQVPRSKSMLPAKEDASLPIVTPSLLQMVRLRSVNVNNHGSENTGKKLDDQSQQNGEENDSQNSAVPQKPLRKSLSLRVSTSSDPVPSMQLQNAVRLKTSSLPYKNFPGPLSPKPFDKDKFAKSSIPAGTGSPTNASPVTESSSPKLNEEGNMYKSSAQTASFIFAKSPRKVVFETPSSPEAQSELKKNLVAELMTVSGQRNTAPGPIALPNQQSTETNSKPPIQKKPTKAPPPVARKPVHLPSTLQPQLKSPVSPHPDSPNQPLSPNNTAEHSTNEQNRTNTGLTDDHTKTMHSLGQETQTSQTKANEETGNTAKPPS
ncbi:uncharacterized protein KIAA1522 homolog isoform X2 [Protopterus annectens]|uniref:uncharacterized protein KIAA1522 homolog isoform X2 n=1 Tax=Protopterus annectens TaxID=7888 RepID=UPI001CFB6E72|nr:uncharacterized protein KIAA1522 homolog isoform X2 [Protopterus annectens]